MTKETNNSYEVQIISSSEELREITPEWDDFLKQRATNFTYRQDPHYIRFHLESIKQNQETILVVRRNGIIESIAPCVGVNTPFKLTFSVFRLPSPPLKVLKILASDFVFSQNADIDKCILLVLSKIQSLKVCDIIFLENLRTNSALYTYFSSQGYKVANFQLQITSPETEIIRSHRLCESYDAWLASLRRKTRGTIRRHIRRLEKRYPGQTAYLKITQPEEVPEFLKMLDQVYAVTWQAKTFGYTPRNTEQNIHYYKKIAEKGWLRSYLLVINNEPAAFIVGYQYNGIFEYSEPGYDPEYSKIGIGSVLNYHMFQDLYETDKPQVIDFGFGENQYKRVLGNEECNAFQAYITFNAKGRIIKIQRLLSFTEKYIRALVTKLKIDKTLRKILKRQ